MNGEHFIYKNVCTMSSPRLPFLRLYSNINMHKKTVIKSCLFFLKWGGGGEGEGEEGRAGRGAVWNGVF